MEHSGKVSQQNTTSVKPRWRFWWESADLTLWTMGH